MDKKERFYQRLEKRGVSRRDFMRYCTYLTATMGLSASFVPKVAEVFAAPRQRPPVIWLHFGECTGCSEGMLRTIYPYVDELVLEILSVEYHETIMAAAGHQAEDQLHASLKKYCGQVYLRRGGFDSHQVQRWLWTHWRPFSFLEIAKEVCPQALATIAIGSLRQFRRDPGRQAQSGRLHGRRRGVEDEDPQHPRLPAQPHQPGRHHRQLSAASVSCQRSTIWGRPLFAYGKTIHDQCPRDAPTFENEEFVEEFGSEEAALGYCLYKMGCRGPETYNNCPVAKFNDGTSWPVEAGHPCIGCSEPDFWDKMTPFYEEF